MRSFPVVIEAVMVGVGDDHAVDDELNALDVAGVERFLITDKNRPCAGAAFTEVVCGIISPVRRTSSVVESELLEHAARALRREERDAQVAAARMIGLDAYADMFADQRVGNVERITGSVESDLRLRRARRLQIAAQCLA